MPLGSGNGLVASRKNGAGRGHVFCLRVGASVEPPYVMGLWHIGHLGAPERS
jgi:hypothetical protein